MYNKAEDKNHKPNGKECIECDTPLTGYARKYCSDKCSKAELGRNEYYENWKLLKAKSK